MPYERNEMEKHLDIYNLAQSLEDFVLDLDFVVASVWDEVANS